MANKELYNKLYSNREYKEGVFEILTIADKYIDNIKFAYNTHNFSDKKII